MRRMKQFTWADTIPWAGELGLFADRSELVEHDDSDLKRSPDGYGRNQPTGLQIHFEGRLYSLKADCFSNVASVHFRCQKKKIFVN